MPVSPSHAAKAKFLTAVERAEANPRTQLINIDDEHAFFLVFDENERLTAFRSILQMHSTILVKEVELINDDLEQLKLYI